MTTLDLAGAAALLNLHEHTVESHFEARIREITGAPGYQPRLTEAPRPAPAPKPAPKVKPERRKAPPRLAQNTWPRSLFRRARNGAKQRGIPFSLSWDEMVELVARAGGRCEVTGVSFSVAVDITRHSSPWKPSIDRIDSRRGYEVGNVRLVCCAANLAMNAWGEDVLRVMAVSMRDGGLLPEAP